MIVVGLMAGTSLDGIDVASADLRLDGDTLHLTPLGHVTVAYPAEVEAGLRAALPPAAVTAGDWCRLDTGVGQAFAAALSAVPGGAAPELVVSHGQTVFHWVAPGSGAVLGTLQIGNPAWIAQAAGVPVISDLRMADVAAGGQGAPLVSLFDALLLPPAERPRAALNLGGIANLTVVPAAGGGWGQNAGDAVAFDAGPANALLDAAVVAATAGAETCDHDGRRAARGRVHQPLLDLLLADPYYRRPPPKTTGKEHFSWAYLEAVLERLPGAGRPALDDLLATLIALTATVVADACRGPGLGQGGVSEGGVAEVVASGGGTANPALMAALAERLPAGCVLRTIDDLGIPSAAKEAYAFAVLGFLSLHGLPGTVPTCTGASRPAILGRLTPAPGGWPEKPAAASPPRRLVVRGAP